MISVRTWHGAVVPKSKGKVDIRIRIDLIQEPATIVFVKDASESPRLVLEGLDIHDLDQENIARFRILNLKRTREVVDFCEIYVEDIFGAVIVLDLTTCPVEALNLHSLTVLDRSAKRN